ncbi:MAG: VacB/RNase II family 3'-5' exoribonuclease [Kiritimatiellae bacterium]|nr:VacB/RNase II family 3'-5' exoribonuclease [Kiritimatiellia bacterium]
MSKFKMKGAVKGQVRRRGAMLDQQPAKSSLPNEFTGIISLTRSGNGFVTPDCGGDDVMIMARDVGTALTGDKVEVLMALPFRGVKRPTGRVLRVVERASRNIVCTLEQNGAFWTAVPITPTYKHTFNLYDAGNAKPGDRIVVRFKAWDNPYFNPDAELVSVIGPASNPSLDTIAVMTQYALERDFPDQVISEAEEVSARLEDTADREDLREKYIFTIDPATAKDFDDALSLDIDEEGNRVLGVHIADVSHYVTTGSALDREARRRGTSVYFVDQVIPMLPEQLSNGVCSLVPNEDRLAFSVFITFSSEGIMLKRRFTKSVICSKQRLTYEQAQEMIDANGQCDLADAECRRLVVEINKLSQQLREIRFKKLSLNISAPELEILMENDEMVGVRPAPHFPAHELVEEAMVAANEAVAMELSTKKLPYIARFHDKPDEEKLEELSASLTMLGIMAGDLTDTRNLVRLLKAVENSPLQYFVSTLVLRSMKRAEYSAENEGHFGLAKRYYSHFTSPIRRYPDLVSHRQLAALLFGERQPSKDELIAIAASSTTTEANAEQASRDLIEIKKYRYLEQLVEQDKIGTHEFEAIIVRVAEFGVFVELPDLQISGMIHASLLSNSFLRYDKNRECLVGGGTSFAAGDSLKVYPIKVNFEERKVDFALVSDGDVSKARTVLSTEGERSPSMKGGRKLKENGRKGKYASKFEHKHSKKSHNKRR